MSSYDLRPATNADVFCLVAECDGALAGQVTVLPAARHIRSPARRSRTEYRYALRSERPAASS